MVIDFVATALSITSSRVTRIVDSLVAKKLMRGVTPEIDRRISNLSLTPKGEKLAAQLVEKITEAKLLKEGKNGKTF